MTTNDSVESTPWYDARQRRLLAEIDAWHARMIATDRGPLFDPSPGDSRTYPERFDQATHEEQQHMLSHETRAENLERYEAWRAGREAVRAEAERCRLWDVGLGIQ